MHPVSQGIKAIIENTPDYSIEVLLRDLGAGQGGEQLLTRKEVAAFFKISTRTVTRWIATGILPFYLVNYERRFKLSDLNAMLRRGYEEKES